MGHAYYEFQHVELANVGSGKKRFTNPMAGHQDLFAEDTQAEPRNNPRARNPPGGVSSNIFAPAEEVAATRSPRNRMSSSIPLGDTTDSPPSSNASSPPPTPVKPAGWVALQAGDHQPHVSLPDPIARAASPNPVTGQGYEPAEVKKAAATPAPPQTPRRRVPPGGFSSPLW